MEGTFWGIFLPFAGTALGASSVFFLRRAVSPLLQQGFMGFAAGVMTAASVWSLLIPSVEQCAEWENWAFVPAALGFLVGVGFLLVADAISPKLVRAEEKTAAQEHWRRTLLMVLVVTLHNLPEGMAVGAAFAGVQNGQAQAGAMALSLGIAVQNFPEGAIISMPLHAAGVKKGRAFLHGVLSGVVEPLGAALTLVLSFIMVPILPYLLAFAAGAMLIVVAQELLPQACGGENSRPGAIGFALGFLIMMILDVTLG